MNILERNKMRSRFKLWKRRVVKKLPDLTIGIYKAKVAGFNLDSDIEKTLGYVIMNINKPDYSFVEDSGKRVETIEDEMALQTILEVFVEGLFQLLNTEIKQFFRNKLN